MTTKQMRLLLPSLSVLLAVLLALPGCGELPLDNSAPGVPYLSSNGTLIPGYGVAVTVAASDADGDRLAFQFRTVTGYLTEDSNWTSYVASGDTAVVFLDLAAGSTTLQARARDELNEMSPYASLELVVGAAAASGDPTR